MINDTSQLDAAIRAKTEPEPYSGVVLLSRGDETLFSGAYGPALRAEEIPNRVDTRFQTASGCKAFTALATLQLVQRGALSLDTPLLDVVPDPAIFEHYAQAGGQPITVRHLITHTSGITSYFEEDVNDDYEALWQDRPTYTMRRPADFLPMFAGKPTKFAPGERFEYNDGGFILLGLVVEQVSGMAFVDYVTQNVFGPAGMSDSGYFAADQLPGRVARAYIKNTDGSWRTNQYAVPIIGGGDGGAYTTAEDMRRFWRALRGGALLGTELATEMLTTQETPGYKPPQGAYGLGVWIDLRDDGVHGISVEGLDPGVAMRSMVYGDANTPWDEAVSLTMLGNTMWAMWSLWREVESILGIS